MFLPIIILIHAPCRTLENTCILEKNIKIPHSPTAVLLGRFLSFCEHCSTEPSSCHIRTRMCGIQNCAYRGGCTHVRLSISLFAYRSSTVFVRLTRNLPERQSACGGLVGCPVDTQNLRKPAPHCWKLTLLPASLSHSNTVINF